MVINDGEIVEFCPNDELMEQKVFYYALYMSRFKSKATLTVDGLAIALLQAGGGMYNLLATRALQWPSSR